MRSYVLWNNFEPASRWQASAIFAPQNQPKVEAAFKDELARSLKDGFTQAELDEARAGLLNFRRLSRAQDSSLTGQLASNLFVGRSFDFAQKTEEAIGRLTLAEVNAAWRRHINADRLVIAWGGDFKQP